LLRKHLFYEEKVVDEVEIELQPEEIAQIARPGLENHCQNLNKCEILL